MSGEIVSAESAEILLEDRIDALDADRLARSVIALHAEVARLQKRLDENIEDRVRAHEILGGAEYESTADAAARVVQDEVSASAEAGRLLAIIAGRTTPPTDAEIEAHWRAGGVWVVGGVTVLRSVADAKQYRVQTQWAAVRWVPMRDGCSCTWPTGIDTP